MHSSTLEAPEEDHEQGAPGFVPTAAADEDGQQFILSDLDASTTTTCLLVNWSWQHRDRFPRSLPDGSAG